MVMEDIFFGGSPSPKKKRSITSAEKKWMWQRKKRHVCQICHKQIKDYFDAEFDHKVAYAKNGKTAPNNTLIVHKLCNRLKGKKSLTQIKKHLGTHKPKKRVIKEKETTKKKVVKKTTRQKPIGLNLLNPEPFEW